jgi:hypothetical protein
MIDIRAARGEQVIDTGRTFGDGEPVLVHVRKRERRYLVSDRGRATEKTGRPPGWREVAADVVAEESLNMNRTGVIFVPAVEGGLDLAWLVMRVADVALRVYAELLELEPG